VWTPAGKASRWGRRSPRPDSTRTKRSSFLRPRGRVLFALARPHLHPLRRRAAPRTDPPWASPRNDLPWVVSPSNQGRRNPVDVGEPALRDVVLDSADTPDLRDIRGNSARERVNVDVTSPTSVEPDRDAFITDTQAVAYVWGRSRAASGRGPSGPAAVASAEPSTTSPSRSSSSSRAARMPVAPSASKSLALR
jgi:hypothetical protein